jgi:catechol 2,3-dioxygenase-like lactoylglutathione lyase family enzyme
MNRSSLEGASAVAVLVGLAGLVGGEPTLAQGGGDVSPHTIGAAKLIVGDLQESQLFYERMFGMKEVRRYDYDLETFEETILGFGEGARLALFAPNPKAEAALEKSQFPVVLIYTPELEAVTSRIEAAGHPIRRLGSGEAGSFRIAITRDPSGNAVEIFARPGAYEVGGSKLIVDDRAKAEAFYAKIFGATPGQRFAAPGVYDEVLMQFGRGPFLALFQPLAEAPLPKSRFPLTAFYTSEFDSVLERIEREGLGYRTVKTQTEGLRIIIARDPAGNAIEIISR